VPTDPHRVFRRAHRGCHVKSIRDLFHDHGLRHTRQREVVYQTLRATDTHPTADDVFEASRAVEPGLSLATVYNTLDAFVRCGLIRASHGGSGPCRYDGDNSDHLHVVHPDGRVADVSPDLSRAVHEALPGDLLDRIAREVGAPLGSVRVNLVADRVPPEDPAADAQT